MSWLQFAVMALISALFAIPAVLFIPRARTSPLFDRLLWLATWLLAFLCAWLAIGYSGNSSLGPVTNPNDIGRLPLAPIAVGAAAGALLLNALLWLLDRLAPPEVEDEVTMEEQGDEDNHSNTPEQP
jgi:hypothetical protein